MLSTLPDQFAASAGPIVARKTQIGPGWVSVSFALVVHAALACLLFPGMPARPVAPPVQPVVVTLDMASSDAVMPPASPEPASAPAVPATPASIPEPQPAPPEPAKPVPIPDAVQPPATTIPDSAGLRANPAPSNQQQASPPVLPSPTRHAPSRPIVRQAAKPQLRARTTEPSPDAAPPVASAAPPAIPAPPAQAAAPVRSPEAAGAWRGALTAWLQEHRSYPAAARRGGVEGRVVVRFTIDGAGQVTAVALVGSSGSAVLDEAALALLRGAHLPPPPAPALDHLSVTLPVRYTLAP